MRSWALAFLFSVEVVSACSCKYLTECELAARPVLFIGKVIAGGVESLRDDPWRTDAKHVRFEVLETFRGLAPGTKFVDLETTLWPGMCSPNPYRPGRTYLVAPGTDHGKFTDGICFTGRDVEDFSDGVGFLRRHFRKPQGSIRGRVGAVHRNDSDLVDYLLRQGEGKLLRGAKVWTSSKGKTISATTDEQGRYELAVPGPGRYSVQADLAPYPSAAASIDVPVGASCVVNDLGLLSNSSITGRVWDRRGQPLPHAKVGLLDLDRPFGEKAAAVPFRTAYPEQSDGSFLFENVPLGRYLLVFNPDGPRADGYQPLPLESTYYPGGAARSRAQVLEIGQAGLRLTGKDVIAGPPIDFRTVAVKVRFPDGSPMTTAVVDILGEPLDPDGIPWIDSGHIGRNKPEVRFQVPAGRKFRISVRDWYRRHLNQAYESTHAPGSTPVNQEFIIVP